jgi:adenylate cyclase
LVPLYLVFLLNLGSNNASITTLTLRLTHNHTPGYFSCAAPHGISNSFL